MIDQIHGKWDTIYPPPTFLVRYIRAQDGASYSIPVIADTAEEAARRAVEYVSPIGAVEVWKLSEERWVFRTNLIEMKP